MMTAKTKKGLDNSSYTSAGNTSQNDKNEQLDVNNSDNAHGKESTGVQSIGIQSTRVQST
jgi:hypothetical protein